MDITNSNSKKFSHDNVGQFINMIQLMDPELITYKWRWSITYSNVFTLSYRGNTNTVEITFTDSGDSKVHLVLIDNFAEDIVRSSDVIYFENYIEATRKNMSETIKEYLSFA